MNFFSYITGLLSFIFHLNPDKEIINLSDYSYPSPNDKNYTYIPIICTTDIHGYAFSRQFPSLSNFSYGGSALLYSYIRAIRSEWGNRVLWFDAGDKYQGGVESTLSNGTIMSEIFNFGELDLSVLGNHEFDNGLDYLMNLMNISDAPTLTTNVKNKKTNGTDAFNNTKNYIQSKIFKMSNDISIGVVGYVPVFSYYKQAVLDNLTFLNISEGITTEAKRLRNEEKVNAVVLLIHDGVPCANDNPVLGVYNVTHSVNDEGCDKTSLLYKYIINEMPEGLLDAIVGGHVHYFGHHFFKKIPVVHSQNNGLSFHVLYLPFKEGKVVHEAIQVEGPIPVCNMISKTTKQCSINEKNIETYPFYFHNYRIRLDKRLERKVLKHYQENFDKYKEYICENEYESLGRGTTENALGNLQCDIIKNVSKADFAIINNGAFRTTWYKGPLYLEDIYNMNPFKSIITSFEVNGEELFNMMTTLQAGDKRYFQTGGMRQYFTKKDNEYVLEKITLLSGEELEKDKNYTFVMNDFLAQGGDNFKEIFKWYTKRNEKTHGDFVSAITSTLKSLGKIENGKYYEDDKSKRRIVYND